MPNETVSAEFVGDVLEMGVELPEFPGGVFGALTGSIRELAIDVTVYADHPDVALYLYHWADYTLRAHLDWMQRQGLIAPRFQNGGAVMPEVQFRPERIFARNQRWLAGGQATSVEPMPDPPRRLYLFLQGVTIAGHRGRVKVPGERESDDGVAEDEDDGG